MTQMLNTTVLRDFAVVFGINEYQDPLDPLKGAQRDAEKFIEWVVHENSDGDVDETRIVKRLSRAEVSDLLKAVDELVAKVEGQGRRLYIFVAGHGAARSPKSAFVFGSEHSTTVDACWDVVELASQLGGIFQEIVLFVDCCRSYVADAQPIPITLKLANRQPPQVHFHCFACRINEIAQEYESDSDARGVFSQSLLSALRGEIGGVVDYHGQVTAHSLTQYLSRPEIGHEPEYDPHDERHLRNIVLARNLEAPSRTLTLQFETPPDSFGLFDGELNALNWECRRVDESTYVVEREEPFVVMVTVPKVTDVNDASIIRFVKPYERHLTVA
jgi:hypothetical protein